MTTIYVTKYALSKGPFSVDAEVKDDEGMAVYKATGSYLQCFHGKDFWLTEEDALADCERRRKSKIASIEKQKTRVAGLTFEIKKLRG